jgi:polysaccharide pyruvyl transferase WcaK-like protein
MNILVSGCIYGAGNIGDEAILEGLLPLLPQKSEVRAHAENPALFRSVHRLRCFPTTFWGLLRGLVWADRIVLGGASLLTDPFGPWYPIQHCCRLLLWSRLMGKPVMFAGIGATKVTSNESLALARCFYSTADYFTVRNELSKAAILSQIPYDPNRVIVSADPAFGMQPGSLASGVRAKLTELGIKTDERPLVGVSVVNESFADRSDYHVQIAKACDDLVSKHNCRVVFLCSEIRDGEKFDQAASRRTARYMKQEYCALPARFYPPQEFLDLISAFDCVITMRMHVLILAAVAGVPAATIVREEKVLQILGELGQKPCGTVDKAVSGEVVEQVTGFLRSRKVESARLLRAVKAQRERLSLTRETLERWTAQHKRANRPRAAAWFAEACRVLTRKPFAAYYSQQSPLVGGGQSPLGAKR